MAENNQSGNGWKKAAKIAPVVVAVIALALFFGIKGDFFASKLESSTTELKLKAFHDEFDEYKVSHDKWATTQIELFRGDIADLKVEVVGLRGEINELRGEIYKLRTK